MYLSDEECNPFSTQWHEAHVLNVVDGDTFDIEIDLGFKIKFEERVRLLHLAGLMDTVGVDAYEMRGKNKALGKKAKAFCERAIGDNNGVIRVATRKDPKKSIGKYGRYLVAVLLPDLVDPDSWISLGDWLIREKLAVEKRYG